MHVRKKLHGILTLFLAVMLCIVNTKAVSASPQIQSTSAILVEASTGKMIYEMNADERRSPASITKIMTLLLTFDALEDGKINLQDQVITSEYASSMGGSQVFLAQGEIQTLETMIKCIVVASGNDASVAVAEHISGSEQAFVEKMNEKAIKLGMLNTHFEDCCGLSDSEEHYTSARDVAIMTRELILKYPQIFQYSQIWMEDIVHKTARGDSIFTLSSTNKLLKEYPYATGLKTGSTSKAGFCLSGTASKDGIDLIAVVMGAKDKNIRLSDVKALFTFGYGICRLYVDPIREDCGTIPVDMGKKDFVEVGYGEEFRYLDLEGNNLSDIERQTELPERLSAPLDEGEKIGRQIYLLHGRKLGEIPIVTREKVDRMQFFDCMYRLFLKYLL